MWNFNGIETGIPSRFEEQYHCYSVAYADKSHLEGGDKILLPPSAFDTLARLQVDYPMLFRLESSDKGTSTHCGVLEFTAEEGSMYIPFWMMQNLLVEEGAVISVKNVSLPKATFVKLQPQHVDFLEITNPRAVLEHALRNFSCVTKGDVICVPYNDKNYHFELKDVKPMNAACIIETDCNVDFDAPIGYKEPVTSPNEVSDSGNSSDFANITKRGAYATNHDNNSSLQAGTNESFNMPRNTSFENSSRETEDSGVKIIEGQILRRDDTDLTAAGRGVINAATTIMAERSGATGVQGNSAIAVKAPSIDYWALNAGNGARLDGRKPCVLKDKQGNVIDPIKLREDSATKRMNRDNKLLAPSTGMTVAGKRVDFTHKSTSEESVSKPLTQSKRKTFVGSKFSKLAKGSFSGNARKMT